jgi:nitrogen fixation-related uncharacterized protein
MIGTSSQIDEAMGGMLLPALVCFFIVCMILAGISYVCFLWARKTKLQTEDQEKEAADVEQPLTGEVMAAEQE